MPSSTASPRSAVPTSASTGPTPSTGIRGATRPSSGPAGRTGRSSSPSGYAACHWCHVMEHESFEDEAHGGAPERGVRLRQGRPRGAARRRRALHAGGPGHDRAGRLADDRRPHAGGRPLLRRHLPPARAPPATHPRRRCSSGARTSATLAPAGRGWSPERVRDLVRRARSCPRSTARDDELLAHRRQRRWPPPFDAERGGYGGRTEVPPAHRAALPPRPRRARRPRTRGSSRCAARWTPWRTGASTTTWAAASTATARTPTGSCRTSRRCSTTTRCSRRRTRGPHA